jgi:thiol-disulfide isomerase/thioredoxin
VGTSKGNLKTKTNPFITLLILIFHERAGKGKYVFIDMYSKGCIWCYRLLPDLNNLYEHFQATRKDIVFAKIDGGDWPEFPQRFKIQYYPTLVLLRPHDTRFSIKYDGDRSFEDMKQFLDSFPNVDEEIKKELTPIEVEKMCKPNVD